MRVRVRVSLAKQSAPSLRRVDFPIGERCEFLGACLPFMCVEAMIFFGSTRCKSIRVSEVNLHLPTTDRI